MSVAAESDLTADDHSTGFYPGVSTIEHLKISYRHDNPQVSSVVSAEIGRVGDDDDPFS